ncbi:uncharacterized protein LOC115888141 [Sitophilus oryzae]|uniref:Uncharacterized protein LOC115888141 n=1 Tax=Sitophilus oryzae TaxID=7048 RepID=A0A6J2YHU4_SITOR|nr:uncharacterized protein LOC115888141 [Sitophilus oryzae]
MRNVEIKAKVKNIVILLQKAKEISQSSDILKQHDTFYNTTKGRLKLRRFTDSGNGELIFYDRPDTEGPKLSVFKKANVEDIDNLNQVLTEALGSKNEVKKVRHLFLAGQTRIHIDEVENLGNYMELEVCLKPEQTCEEGEKVAYEIMKQLGVQKEDLVSGAYADLLLK